MNDYHDDPCPVCGYKYGHSGACSFELLAMYAKAAKRKIEEHKKEIAAIRQDFKESGLSWDEYLKYVNYLLEPIREASD